MLDEQLQNDFTDCMALRVLLADESSTIKKVFQLALQDYGVDVRPVNVGVDVITVAKTFKPDIIFADVLLQKRNGYDVAADLKQDQLLKGIPVVLMWSGFMEFDEDKFQASQANSQLEKPFDVTALRKLVQDLVPRTQTQKLSEFLTFPKLPEIEEKETPAPLPEPPDLSEDEDFRSVSIPSLKGSSGGDKYRLGIDPQELEEEHLPVDYEMPGEPTVINQKPKLPPQESVTAAPKRDPADEFFIGNEPEEQYVVRETKARSQHSTPPPMPPSATATQPSSVKKTASQNISANVSAKSTPTAKPAPAVAQNASQAMTSPQGTLTAAQLEKIVREQSQDIIESVVWKVIPDLATQIIERELNRLLRERESR